MLTEERKMYPDSPTGWHNVSRATIERDVELFAQLIGDFVPPNAFDAHVHLYDRSHCAQLPDGHVLKDGPAPCGWQGYREQLSQWMGDRTCTAGLVMPYPDGNLDTAAAHQLITDEISQNPDLRGLMIVRPTDLPDQVEQQIEKLGFVGFKPYLFYADRADQFQAEVGDFVPEFAWDIADKRGLVILLHLVKNRALADPANLKYLRDHCLRYPNAKLILAHCGRCFNAGHALEAMGQLRDLDNVFFDCSGICEPYPMEQIIKVFGPTRLMFGMDFPICQLRGKAASLADGFIWVLPDNFDWSAGGAQMGADRVPLGLESIYALKQACNNQHLNDHDIELIFARTARQLFAIGPQPSGTGQQLYRRAKEIIPGGTQLFGKRSEFSAPEQWPAYFREARGCLLTDMDDRHYIDMSNMGILACIFGYADPDITAAVLRRVQFGSMTTLNPPEEVAVAEIMLEMHPWAQNVRFTRTGGEAMTVAVRFARSITGREAVAICGYHGWHDWYLAANLGQGDDNLLKDHLLPGLLAHGVPASLAGTTFPFHFNKLEELEAIFARRSDLAAVVLEPSRSEAPTADFVEGVRRLCDQHGAKLIVDEISIGFRLVRGGAHLKYGFKPDLAVFAKTISNGYPMSAIIGTAETMDGARQSFISSAYWSEAIGPAAALATLTKMKQVDVVGYLDKIGAQVKQNWQSLADKHQLPIKVTGHNCVPVLQFEHPQNAALVTLMTVRMLRAGFLAGTMVVVTTAHKPHHIAAYTRALDDVFAELAEAIRKDDIESRIGGPVKSSGFARLT